MLVQQRLIDNDFPSSDYNVPKNKVTTDQLGVYELLHLDIPVMKQLAEDQTLITALATPELTTSRAMMTSIYVYKGILRLKTHCDYNTMRRPGLLCKYFDYIFSDDGIILANYGEEGKTFSYEGETLYSIWNFEGWAATSYFNIVLLFNGPAYTIWSRENTFLPQESLKQWIFGTLSAQIITPVTLTSNESTEFTSCRA